MKHKLFKSQRGRADFCALALVIVIPLESSKNSFSRHRAAADMSRGAAALERIKMILDWV